MFWSRVTPDELPRYTDLMQDVSARAFWISLPFALLCFIGIVADYFEYKAGFWINLASLLAIITIWVIARNQYVQLANKRDKELGKPLPRNATYLHMQYPLSLAIAVAFLFFIIPIAIIHDLGLDKSLAYLWLVVSVVFFLVFVYLHGKYREHLARQDDLRYD